MYLALSPALRNLSSHSLNQDCANFSNTCYIYTPKRQALPLTLAGDASTHGIGAVISHIMPDTDQGSSQLRRNCKR